MPYTLLVCADCWSEKVNLELAFPHQPSVAELTAHVEYVFEEEMKLLKPPNAPMQKFQINRIQIYDDVELKWSTLTDSQQLHEYDQLYCFQPPSPWQVDTQKDLPAPRPPSAAGVRAGAVAQPSPVAPASYGAPAYSAPTYSAAPPVASPQYVTDNRLQPMAQGLAQPQGNALLARERPNIPDAERQACAFTELDEGSKGYVLVDELERGFRTRGIDFSTNTVQELFQKADLRKDQRLDREEWAHFATVYPNTVDAVYYRGRDLASEQALRDAMAGTQRDLDSGRQKEAELHAAAEAQAQQNQALLRQLQEQEQQLREAAERRNLLEQQERALIEQEVKLERQKDALRHSMHKFKETAAAFDRDAAGHGSPRRSRAPDLSQGLGL
eukprot:TRINITY_DN3411_c0_g1_i1.p1 TRINITY_DN3411_c0_g1~~TRINITY_DN3411_c0_g1_i1.p1  ORF type:complete len:385 (+),score=151.42 TRINITY_DN3411_c0_g1_i1:67-1221(+)